MDLSFLRFYDSLNQDLFESNATQITRYNDIHLSPNETYTFITNKTNGYFLNTNNVLNFIDCQGNILGVANATFYQLSNGQFAWSITPSSFDFFEKEVRLSLNNELFTNPFIYSNHRIKETIRIDFTHDYELDGTAYDLLPIYQGVRIKCWFSEPDFPSIMQSYTTIDGQKLSAREIKTLQGNFVCDFVSNLTYLSLSHAFSCDTIYVNGKRITDKPTIKLEKYNIEFNQKKIEFTGAFNFDDTYDYGGMVQILGDFDNNDFNNNDFNT